jgi:uncharacterized Zn finger protein (UPF0148 family)
MVSGVRKKYNPFVEVNCFVCGAYLFERNGKLCPKCQNKMAQMDEQHEINLQFRSRFVRKPAVTK